MATFKVIWRNGDTEQIDGNDIADAMNRAGYGAGAVRAVDYYAPVEPDHDKIIVQFRRILGKTGYGNDLICDRPDEVTFANEHDLLKWLTEQSDAIVINWTE